jgi:hypothetical protein
MVRVALCAGCRWGISIGLFEEARALGIKKVVNAASALELAPFKAALMAEIGEGDETRGLLNGLARNSHYWRRQEGNLVTIVRDHDLCHETCFHKRPGFVASSGVTLYSFFDYLANNPKQIRDRVRALGCRLPTGDDWHFDCLVEPFKDLLYYGLLGYTEADFHVSQMIRYGLISRRAGVKEIRAKRQRIIMGISHVFDLAEGIGCDDTTLSMLQGFVADSPYLSSRPEGVRQLTELRQKPAPVAKRK